MAKLIVKCESVKDSHVLKNRHPLFSKHSPLMGIWGPRESGLYWAWSLVNICAQGLLSFCSRGFSTCRNKGRSGDLVSVPKFWMSNPEGIFRRVDASLGNNRLVLARLDTRCHCVATKFRWLVHFMWLLIRDPTGRGGGARVSTLQKAPSGFLVAPLGQGLKFVDHPESFILNKYT